MRRPEETEIRQSMSRRSSSIFGFGKVQGRRARGSIAQSVKSSARMSVSRPRFSSTVSQSQKRRMSVFNPGLRESKARSSFRRSVRRSVRNSVANVQNLRASASRLSTSFLRRQSTFQLSNVALLGSQNMPQLIGRSQRNPRLSLQRFSMANVHFAGLTGRDLEREKRVQSRLGTSVIKREERPELYESEKWIFIDDGCGFKFYWNTVDETYSLFKPVELLSPHELSEEEGSWTWVPHRVNMWQPATVVSEDAGRTQCKLLTGKTMSISKMKIVKNQEYTGGVTQRVPFWPLKKQSLDRYPDDLCELDEVNEGSVLHTLRLRFEGSEIYSWIGSSRDIIVAVNPFQDLGLYTEFYKEKYRKSAQSLNALNPHVYGIAAKCMQKVVADKRNCAIIVSGISGAGKTQATRQCLDFLAHIAGPNAKGIVAKEKVARVEKKVFGRGARKGKKGGKKKKKKGKQNGPPLETAMIIGETNNIDDKILRSNPIMEAFGNAKTVRNNNSSRFGKWVEVTLDTKTNKIVGGRIDQFLLETTRVIIQAEGERNYHIFYQVFTNEELRNRLELTMEPSEYHFINQGHALKVEGDDNPVDDREGYEELVEAMEKLSFSKEERDWFFTFAGGLLHLGNIDFVDNGGKAEITEATRPHVASCAKLFDIDETVLVDGITTKKFRETSSPLSKTNAIFARNSLAKAVYGKGFEYLIQVINEKLGVEVETTTKFIGILDIFGFENFKFNYFEQLCINYTNETLQKLFNDTVYSGEQIFYETQKISYDKVKFDKNEIALNILNVVLQGTDDECVTAKGQEENIIKKAAAKFGERGKYLKCEIKKMTFKIKHFAGEVEYIVNGFILKNKDVFNAEMQRMFQDSSDTRTKALFKPLSEDERVTKVTTGARLKGQLNQLIDQLKSTDCHYIRTVKPNEEQRKELFLGRIAMEQLNAVGVVDSIKARQKGFLHKLSHNDFVTKYKCVNKIMLEKDIQELGMKEEKNICIHLIEECFKDKISEMKGIQVGTSHVLFKNDEYQYLELNRLLTSIDKIRLFQAFVRARPYRQFFQGYRNVNKELQDAVARLDEEKVMELQKSGHQRLGPLANKFKFTSSAFDTALKKIQWERDWEPVNTRLAKYKAVPQEAIDNRTVAQDDELSLEEVNDILHEIYKLNKIHSGVPGAVRAEANKLITIRSIIKEESEKMQLEKALRQKEEAERAKQERVMKQRTEDNIGNSMVDVNFEADVVEEIDETSEAVAPKKSLKHEEGVEDQKMVSVSVDVNIDETDKKKSSMVVHESEPIMSGDVEDAIETGLIEEPALEDTNDSDEKAAVEAFEEKAKEALRILDKSEMTALLVVADENKINSRFVPEMEAMIILPEIDFLRLHLSKLKAQGDDMMVKLKEVELKEAVLAVEQFEKYRDFFTQDVFRNPSREVQYFCCFCIPYSTQYEEETLDTLRVEFGDNASHRLLNQKKQMFVWNQEQIFDYSLIRIDDPDIEDQAFEAFDSMVLYAEDDIETPVGQAEREEALVKIIKKGMFGLNQAREKKLVGIRNEIYAQVVKQLTENKSPDSKSRMFDLLRYCLLSFPPDTEAFTNFLIVWMRRSFSYPVFRRLMDLLNFTMTQRNDRAEVRALYQGANSQLPENLTVNQLDLMEKEIFKNGMYFPDYWDSSKVDGDSKLVEEAEMAPAFVATLGEIKFKMSEAGSKSVKRRGGSSTLRKITRTMKRVSRKISRGMSLRRLDRVLSRSRTKQFGSESSIISIADNNTQYNGE